MQQKPPEATKCPQCSSDGCGPLRCRFSMIEHAEAQRIRRRIKSAGNGGMLKIDRHKKQQYHFIAEQLDFRTVFDGHPHYLVMHLTSKEPK